jgi:ferredoxin-type protein NapH
MADSSGTTAPAPDQRGVWRSLLLTLPVFLWALLMFSRAFTLRDWQPKAAAAAAFVFMVSLFYLMVRTRHTYRWRRIFFVTLGFLFPIGFIASLVAVRGSMSIPIERMIAGDTPFCFLAIPMLIVPAALTRTIIFPGSILPTATNDKAIATMIALWLAATIVLGKGWCSYGCFFGGIEEGFAALRRRALIRRFHPSLRLAPWGVLAAIVLLSAATYSPTYCEWLCPFKAVTEFPEVRSAQTAVQFGIFSTLFLGLVVTLPVLTKRRTQCTFLCPFGAFQSIFNKTSVFDIRVDPARCVGCTSLCTASCPTLSIDESSIKAGKTLLSCMRCGACVDACHKGAAVWHIKGTPLSVRPETARLMYLYAAWIFATMFGGSIIAGSIETVLRSLA